MNLNTLSISENGDINLTKDMSETVQMQITNLGCDCVAKSQNKTDSGVYSQMAADEDKIEFGHYQKSTENNAFKYVSNNTTEGFRAHFQVRMPDSPGNVEEIRTAEIKWNVTTCDFEVYLNDVLKMKLIADTNQITDEG